MITSSEASTWAIEPIETWVEKQLSNPGFYLVQSIPEPYIDQKSHTINQSEMTRENSWFASCTSEFAHQEFLANPDRWYRYHDLYREAREKEWMEIPFQYLATLPMLTRPGLVICDFGAGEALLATELPQNRVLGFDHVAINASVTACDLKNVPLPDQSVDRVVCSLSLMGLNWTDYLAEAIRVLVVGGFLFGNNIISTEP